MAEYLRNQIAKMAEVNLDTLRYYEKMGLITPKRLENGYRVYSEENISRLGFIKRAKEAGFTLDEIRQTLMLFEYNLDLEQLTDVMAEGIQAKIKEIELRMRRLKEVRDVLAEIHQGIKEGKVCPTMASLLKR